MRNFSFNNLKLTNKGHELDNIYEHMFAKGNKYYIVGSGREIITFLKRTGNDIKSNILGLILTEENDRFSGFFSLPVYKDHEILFERNVSIICVSRGRQEYNSVRQLFEGYGFIQNINFFQGEIFSMIYEVYEKNEIKIDRIEIFMTSYCTLKCKKCIAFNPYFKKREHISLDMLKEDADLLFSKIDYVYKLKILGGDAFCYPYLVEYLDYLNKYKSKIGSIRVGTNGTILPTEAIINSCIRNNATLDISDYSRNVAPLCKMEEIIELCKDSGVTFDIKRTGEQWLDVGFPDNIPPKKTEEKLQTHYVNCGMFCRDFLDGKLYYCCSNFAAVKSGLYPESKDDYFDFSENFTKKELLEYELGFCNLGHTTFCNVCRGCSDEVNPLHVEVAKQM